LSVVRHRITWCSHPAEDARQNANVSRLPDGRVVEEWSYYRQMKGNGGAR